MSENWLDSLLCVNKNWKNGVIAYSTESHFVRNEKGWFACVLIPPEFSLNGDF